jgi:hypothetical protein
LLRTFVLQRGPRVGVTGDALLTSVSLVEGERNAQNQVRQQISS